MGKSMDSFGDKSSYSSVNESDRRNLDVLILDGGMCWTSSVGGGDVEEVWARSVEIPAEIDVTDTSLVEGRGGGVPSLVLVLLISLISSASFNDGE